MQQPHLTHISTYFPHIIDTIVYYSHGDVIESLMKIKNVKLLELLVKRESIKNFVNILNDCYKKVKNDWKKLEHVDEIYQTKRIHIVAINNCYRAIKFVKEQTPKICIAAFKDDWKEFKKIVDFFPTTIQVNKYALCALQFVTNQTEEICLAAVQHCGFALSFVKEQTEKICLAAVKQNGLALKYVKEQTEEICLAAVLNNSGASRYVNEEFKCFVKNNM